MSIENKRIFITGGSSGIGLALVKGFLKNGAAVAFSYCSDNALSRPDVKALLNSHANVFAIKADFSEELDTVGLLAKAADNLGGEINVLINNAATYSRAEFMETDKETFRNILNVNTLIPFLLIRAFADRLIAKSMRGNIINITSLSASMARSQMTAYQCSKAALEMLSNSAAYELARHQIRSNILSPGLTETSANQEQRENDLSVWEKRSALIPLGRAGKPEDYISAALFLADDKASWITGARIVIDGGLSTF